MTTYHVAQLNVAVAAAPLTDPSMADFVNNLSSMNALADASPGFVWRLQDEGTGDSTTLRPFGPDIMVNMSVWETVEALRSYVYRSGHLDFLRRRRDFFRHDGLDPYQVLWWVPAGRIPTVDDAWQRLELLRRHGAHPEAFSFRMPFPAPSAVQVR